MKRPFTRILTIVLAATALAAAAFAWRPGREPAPDRPFEPLTPEEYRRVEGEFVALLDGQGPGTALLELRRRVSVDPAVARDCHAIAHALGHEAYEKAGDFAAALSENDEICNSGFFHGVIESRFAAVEDVPAEMRIACAPHPSDTYLGWQCYHGVGHGLMFQTGNDLPRVIALCEAYEDVGARDSCINGAYMENFNAERKVHPSRFLDASDPFMPCGRPETAHKSECYLYAPTFYLALHPGRYEEALRWCRGAEPEHRAACAQGVGSQAMKEHLDDPAFVERVCRRGRADETASCIYGMSSYAIFHFGELGPARGICAALKRADRPACEEALARNAYLFRAR